MYEANFVMLGTSTPGTDANVREIFLTLYSHNPDIEFVERSYEICELFKYTINVFLGTKVWFFNEIYEITEKLGIEYNELRELFKYDPRIGESHTAVPGQHGFGFSGACFPKENRGFRHLQQQLGIPNTALTEVSKRNDYFNKKPMPPQ
jgi:UDPglucose 6-dehydrogenase